MASFKEEKMDMRIALAFALPIGLGLAALGGALGLGKAIAGAIEAMGRQPEISTKILINMVLGCALIEAVVIYVLVFSFILYGKL
jgi:F-type H+-transporting ATPase subunit c